MIWQVLRLYRALLQSETQALDDRLYESYGVREAGGISLGGCQQNRVQAKLMRWEAHSALGCQPIDNVGLLHLHRIKLAPLFVSELATKR